MVLALGGRCRLALGAGRAALLPLVACSRMLRAPGLPPVRPSGVPPRALRRDVPRRGLEELRDCPRAPCRYRFAVAGRATFRLYRLASRSASFLDSGTIGRP